jgi:hypothetical protein
MENSTDDKHFVIRVDGRVKSHHRRFLDALREGLQLRDQFPQHDVKVQSMTANGQQRTAFHWFRCELQSIVRLRETDGCGTRTASSRTNAFLLDKLFIQLDRRRAMSSSEHSGRSAAVTGACLLRPRSAPYEAGEYKFDLVINLKSAKARHSGHRVVAAVLGNRHLWVAAPERL